MTMTGHQKLAGHDRTTLGVWVKRGSTVIWYAYFSGTVNATDGGIYMQAKRSLKNALRRLDLRTSPDRKCQNFHLSHNTDYSKFGKNLKLEA